MAVLRIGTRGSRLALVQAAEVRDALDRRGVQSELVPIVTSGDRGASPAVWSPAGVKGLFVGEIVRALQDGEVDLAVHSAKDLPAEDAEGVAVAAVPERGDPLDVLVMREPGEPRPAAPVGTSSLRRQALLRRMRPDLEVVELRGNVDTRLRKLAEGEVDALVVAAAGLRRLGIEPEHAMPLPLEDMVPAPGQGALAVQARAGGAAEEAARGIDHAPSRAAFEAERRLVSLLDAGCRTPLGAYAEWRKDAVRMLAVVIRIDGRDVAWAQVEAPTPAEAAEEAATALRAGGAGEMLEDARRG